jgi:hypothetical protein
MNSEQSYASTIRKMEGREYYCRVNSERQHKKYFGILKCSYRPARFYALFYSEKWRFCLTMTEIACGDRCWSLPTGTGGTYFANRPTGRQLLWRDFPAGCHYDRVRRHDQPLLAAPQTAQTLTSQRGGSSNMHDRYCSDTTLPLQHILDMCHKW